MIFAYPYIIVFSIYVFLSVFKTGTSNKDVIIFFSFFSFFLLFIFIGLKGYMYGDWIVYRQIFLEAPTIFQGFNRIHSFINFEHFNTIEHGYLFWIIFCKSFVNDFLVFQSISFIIDYIFLFKLFREYLGKYWILGLCFYYLYGLLSMEIVYLRNVKALILFIYSIRYIGKSFKKYLILNILACFFHISSIIYIPLYFFLSKKWNRKIFVILFLIGNFLYLFQISITRVFFVKLADIFYIPKLTTYLNSSFGTSNGITIGYIERFFTFLLFISFYGKINLKNKNEIYNCFYIYMILNFFFFDFYIISGRFGSIFVFSYWFIYPGIYAKLKKDNKIVFVLFLLLYGCLKLYTLTNLPWCKYNTIINDIGNKNFEKYVEESMK